MYSELLIIFFQNVRGCAPRVFKVKNQQYLVYLQFNLQCVVFQLYAHGHIKVKFYNYRPMSLKLWTCFV